MNSIRIENLNIQYDQRYYTINEASELLKRRDNSLLTKQWFMIKMHNSKLIPLYDGEKHVYIQIDRHDSMYGVQFYNSYGDLIMTYPWNGVMSCFHEGQMVNDRKERFDSSRDSRLKAINVIFRDNEIIICDEINEFGYLSKSDKCYHQIRTFTYSGEEKNVHPKLISSDKYNKQVESVLISDSYTIDAKTIDINNSDDEKIINY